MRRMRDAEDLPLARQTDLSQPSNRRILGLAIPALGALAADPLLSLVDTAFVGRLGSQALASLAIDVAIFGFVFAVFNFLAYATTPLVAGARGRGDLVGSGRVIQQAITLSVFLGVIVGTAVVLLARLLVELFGPEAAVVGPAVDYLRLRAVAIPALLIITAGHGAFRGMQDTRTPMWITIAVNGLNAVLDPVLMFGADLGLTGAAGATVVAQWIGAGVFLVVLRNRGRSEGWGLRAVPLASTRPLLAVGGLLMIRTLLLVSSLAVATAAATDIGTVAVAAHQVVSQIWFLLAMIVDALAITAQALVGESWGSGRRSQARDLSVRLYRWGMAAGLVLAVVVWLSSGVVSSVFGLDSDVAAAARSALVIAAVMQPVAALVFVADGVFLGMVEIRWLAASTGAGFGAMVIGAVLVVAAGGGLMGVWWAVTGMVVARGLVLAVGWRRVMGA